MRISDWSSDVCSSDLLDAAPVVMTLPVSRQFPRIGERHALVPIVDRLLFGPARRGEAGLEIVDRRLRHIDAERADVVDFHGFSPCPPLKSSIQGRAGALQPRSSPTPFRKPRRTVPA